MLWIALLPRCSPPHSHKSEDALRLLAWQALVFSPRVVMLEEAVLMEVEASLRLFGGLEGLLISLKQALGPELEAEACELHLAVAPTDLAALCLVRSTRLRKAREVLEPLDAQALEQPEQLGQGEPLKQRLDPLVFTCLSALATHQLTLAQIGCRTLGDVRKLPRGPLARRIGEAAIDALDRAYGLTVLSSGRYHWLSLPEQFISKLELPYSVQAAEALLFSVHRLLRQAQAWLAAKQAGTRQLILSWTYDRHYTSHAVRLAMEAANINSLGESGRAYGASPAKTTAAHELVINTGSTTRDLSHWGRLLGEQLQRLSLLAPVTDITLRVDQFEPLSLPTLGLLPELPTVAEQTHAVEQLLERLSARLGAQQVLKAALVSDHRAALQQSWLPACEAYKAGETAATHLSVPIRAAVKQGLSLSLKSRSALTTSPLAYKLNSKAAKSKGSATPLTSHLPMPHPSWLLETPLALALNAQEQPLYQGLLQLIAGPQRLEVGWWEGLEKQASISPHQALQLRDYYIAQSPQAGLLWVYRERPMASHGAHRLAQFASRWYLQGIYA